MLENTTNRDRDEQVLPRISANSDLSSPDRRAGAFRTKTTCAARTSCVLILLSDIPFVLCTLRPACGVFVNVVWKRARVAAPKFRTICDTSMKFVDSTTRLNHRTKQRRNCSGFAVLIHASKIGHRRRNCFGNGRSCCILLVSYDVTGDRLSCWNILFSYDTTWDD
jgi:hypothetical protein